MLFILYDKVNRKAMLKWTEINENKFINKYINWELQTETISVCHVLYKHAFLRSSYKIARAKCICICGSHYQGMVARDGAG